MHLRATGPRQVLRKSISRFCGIPVGETNLAVELRTTDFALMMAWRSLIRAPPSVSETGSEFSEANGCRALMRRSSSPRLRKEIAPPAVGPSLFRNCGRRYARVQSAIRMDPLGRAQAGGVQQARVRKLSDARGDRRRG